MSERNFRARLNAAANKNKRQIDWMPVENRAMNSMPDQNFINENSVSGWVELKFVDKLNEKIVYKKGQSRWHKKHHERGGFCFVAVYCKETYSIYLYKGSQSEELELKKNISSGPKPFLIFDGAKRDLKLIDYLARI